MSWKTIMYTPISSIPPSKDGIRVSDHHIYQKRIPRIKGDSKFLPIQDIRHQNRSLCDRHTPHQQARVHEGWCNNSTSQIHITYIIHDG